MNLQAFILFISLFLAINAYYDNKYLNLLKTYKKHYHSAAYLTFGLFLILYINKNPTDGLGLIKYATNTVKYLPIDKQSSDFLTPLLKKTDYFVTTPNLHVEPRNFYTPPSNKPKYNKRSVSETKKKYVAAQQGWKCAHCQKQLPAWFEVDHNTRLDRGGSNEIDNLSALCRDCHGKKTAEENLNIL